MARFSLEAVAALVSILALPASGQTEYQSIVSNDHDKGDRFGISMDSDATRILVGSRGDDEAGLNTGAAYLFDLATGQQLAKFMASDAQTGDRFGWSVALDGNHALIGARDNGPGAAYLFDVVTGQELYRFSPASLSADANFGDAVALADGYALIGASRDDVVSPFAGSAHLFETTTGTLVASLQPPELTFASTYGVGVALAGGRAYVGAPHQAGGAGKVYEYDLAGQELRTWNGIGTARLGQRLAADQGRLAVTSLYGSGGIVPSTVVLIDLATSAVVQTFDDPLADPNTRFGFWSIALDGDRLIVGASDANVGAVGSGTAWVFDTETGSLLFQLTPSVVGLDDFAGTSVAVVDSTYLVGVPEQDVPANSGEVLAFRPEAYVYCTAKTNSLGCLPQVTMTGFASLTSANPQQVVGTDFASFRNGLLFYGTTGEIAAPFLGGTLCTMPPLRYAPVMNSGGGAPGDCSGLYAFDFRAWLQQGVDAGLVAGVTVRAQYWARDPAIADGTGSSVSNAVGFTIGI